VKAEQFIPKPGKKVSLSDYDPDSRDGYDKESAAKLMAKLQARMAELQEMLYAQGQKSLLVVLQAMDAGGKDGTIRRVFDSVNPQGVRVHSFGVPTEEELSHDFLWRVHARTPGKGYIGIFNRSHYEDVLVVRVARLAPPDVWKKRFDHINDFERILHESGTRVIKFFLNISKEEQKERFQERLDRPDKHWKWSSGDLKVREQWDEYMEAFEDVLSRCNTEYAPWYVVPANRKWYRDLVVSQAIVDTLESMDLGYPEPPADVEFDKIVIPD
jgi:PPK2 family polyphosphate:nucleotide phosphotransferase